MLHVEKLLDAVLLVLTLSVVGLLLSSSDSLNALLKVMLEAVAHTLSSSLAQSGEGVLRFIFVFFFFLLFFFDFVVLLQKGQQLEIFNLSQTSSS